MRLVLGDFWNFNFFTNPYGRGSLRACKRLAAFLSRARQQGFLCLFQQPPRRPAEGIVHLTAAVGPGCPNHSKDVRAIQSLLNRTGATTQTGKPLAVDASAGPLTLTAIKEFQCTWTPLRDGRIDPRGITLHKLISVADEFQLMISTVYGEAAQSSPAAWKAILSVMQNRVGQREWSQYTSLTAIIHHTRFDAHNQRNAPYMTAFHYMNHRSSKHTNGHVEQVIAALRNPYATPSNVACDAVLYYSPKAQAKLHKAHPALYAEKPNWNFNLLTEVRVSGLLATDDFKFYTYK